MKRNIFLLLIVGLFVAVLTSCNTSQTITVTGVPGTVITNPQNQQLAVVDQSGQAKVELKRKGGYYHFLQAQAPGSYLQVPFALDYKNRNTTLGWIGVGMTFAGLSEVLGMLFSAVLSGDYDMLEDDSNLMIMGASLGVSLVGCSIGLSEHAGEADYVYKYQKKQITNNDIIR